MNISPSTFAARFSPTPLGNFTWKEFNGEEGAVEQRDDTFYTAYRLGSSDGYATLKAALSAAHRITTGEQSAAVVLEKPNGRFGLQELLVLDPLADSGVYGVHLESNINDDGSHAYDMRAKHVSESLRAIVDGDFERRFTRG